MNKQTKMNWLVEVSRPKMWMASLFYFLLAYEKGLPLKDPVFWIAVFFIVFPFNLLLMGWNDVADYEADCLNPRKKVISLDQFRALPSWMIIWNVPFYAYFIKLYGSQFVTWIQIAIASCVAYNGIKVSWSKNRQGQMSRVPIIDIFMNIWLWAPCYHLGCLTAMQSGNTSPWGNWAVMLWTFSNTARGQLVAAVWDYHPDLAAGKGCKNTIATLFGPLAAIHLNSLLLVAENLLLLRPPAAAAGAAGAGLGGIGGVAAATHLVAAAPMLAFSALDLASAALRPLGVRLAARRWAAELQYRLEVYYDGQYSLWVLWATLVLGAGRWAGGPPAAGAAGAAAAVAGWAALFAGWWALLLRRAAAQARGGGAAAAAAAAGKGEAGR